jgi:Glycosyltransferase family 87
VIDKLINTNIKLGKYSIDLPSFLWFTLGTIAAVLELCRGESQYQNYFTFQYFYQHIHSLTNPYFGPIEQFDCHYGPTFSMVILPFTLCKPWLGCFLWCLCNIGFLYFAIKKLGVNTNAKKIILLIAVVELMTATHNVQFNAMVAAWMILAFVYVEEENEKMATFFIVLGFLTKIFGITGLTFFLFSKHKSKFIGWFLVWFAVLFCLPMLMSSPHFIVSIYTDWIQNVLHKNELNIAIIANGMQDISFGGLIRRVLGFTSFNDVYLFVPFIVLYILPLLKKQNWDNDYFKYCYLISTLLTVVVLNSSSESPTYIIAVVGCAMWYAMHSKSKVVNTLILLVFIFTSLGTTDVFPHYIRSNYFIGHSLKALPCVLVWLILLWEVNVFGKVENKFKMIKN